MKIAILTLAVLGLLVVGVADTASAHITIGVDFNHDGDCADPGESAGEVPGPVHDDVCVPGP